MATYRITFDVVDVDVGILLSSALRSDVTVYHCVQLGLDEPAYVGTTVTLDEVDLTDDEAAADVGVIHDAYTASLLARLNALESVVAEAEADLTPPHGIKRPDYYVLRQNITQGSGQMIPGLERVQCPSCTAGVGEVCITNRYEGYRRGYGHAARRKAFAKASGGQS